MLIVDPKFKEQFDMQIQLIKSGMEDFDGGNFLAAINLAVKIRVLVHDTKKSNSLLKQMGFKDKLGYHDTSLHRIKNVSTMPGTYIGLMKFVVGNDKVFALLDDSPYNKILSFDERRNGEIFIDIDGVSLSRKDVVLNIANKILAHVDLNFDAGYEKIMQNNSLGISTGNNEDGYQPIKKLEYVAIRQIIHELLKSMIKDYKCRYTFEGSCYMIYINF